MTITDNILAAIKELESMGKTEAEIEAALVEFVNTDQLRERLSTVQMRGKGFVFEFSADEVRVNCCVLPAEVYAYPDELTDAYIKAQYANAEMTSGIESRIEFNELIYDMFKDVLRETALAQIVLKEFLEVDPVYGIQLN